MMRLLLLISLLAGPTLYEWTDSKGGVHYTDDPSTIPPNAKRRVTTGAEVMTTPAAGKGDGGVAPTPAPTVDSCAEAQRVVSQLERQVQEEKLAAQQGDEAQTERCREQLNVMGDPAYARCMASRTKAPASSTGEAQLEAAREKLRRVQISGCH